jgi:dihydrodipicolinate reductase
MNIVVIDGQGGRMGKQLIETMRKRFGGVHIRAIGTIAAASTAMLKGGADEAATGENPLIVACRDADVIVGPIGIVIADSLLGEVTPKMAVAVAQSTATRVLLPMNRCDNLVAGLNSQSLSDLIEDAVDKIAENFPCITK